MTVYKAIAAVMADLSKEGISKDKRNQQQGYSFRGIDDVFNALSPLLAKHGLCILPRVLKREQVERQTLKGGALFYTTVEVEFDFVSAEDGSSHTVKTFGEAMDSADKSTNKAMSAAYKYAALQAFAIPTEGDNDADATTHEVAAKPIPKQEPKPAQKPQAKATEPTSERYSTHEQTQTPFDEPTEPAKDPDALVDEVSERVRLCKTREDLEALKAAKEFKAMYRSLDEAHQGMVRQSFEARELGIAKGA